MELPGRYWYDMISKDDDDAMHVSCVCAVQAPEGSSPDVWLQLQNFCVAACRVARRGQQELDSYFSKITDGIVSA